jgi:hypothetical protein
MTTDWLVNSNFGRISRIFGTAVDSANSNFGWSSLGKPADDGDSAPAGVAEGAPLLHPQRPCGPQGSSGPPPPQRPLRHPLRRSSLLRMPQGPLRTAGPAGPPGSLIAVCVASVSGPSVRPGKLFAF